MITFIFFFFNTRMDEDRSSVNSQEFSAIAATTEFEWDSDGSVPVAVVETVASVTGQSPTEMEPLSEVVDTDALDQLFTSRRSTPRHLGCVQFQYQGYLVEVSATGSVRVGRPTR